MITHNTRLASSAFGHQPDEGRIPNPPCYDLGESVHGELTMPHDISYTVPFFDALFPTEDFSSDPPLCVHYVPPSAVSTKYYALQDPNVYPDPPKTRAVASDTPTVEPTSCPALGQTQTSRAAPSPPPYRVHPKHRRNKDDPGGVSGPLAQHTAPCGFPQEQSELAGALNLDAVFTYSITHAGPRTPTPPRQLQSTSTIGFIALSDSRADRKHDEVNAEEGPTAERACRSLPRSRCRSPERPTPPPMDDASTAALTMASDAAGIVVYSPTTARRIPVMIGPAGELVLQEVEGSTEPTGGKSRARHKRLTSTPSACAFCKRRKIACGGRVESDGARRCGQCIQRRQPCEWSGESQAGITIQRDVNSSSHGGGSRTSSVKNKTKSKSRVTIRTKEENSL